MWELPYSPAALRTGTELSIENRSLCVATKQKYQEAMTGQGEKCDTNRIHFAGMELGFFYLRV